MNLSTLIPNFRRAVKVFPFVYLFLLENSENSEEKKKPKNSVQSCHRIISSSLQSVVSSEYGVLYNARISLIESLLSRAISFLWFLCSISKEKDSHTVHPTGATRRLLPITT